MQETIDHRAEVQTDGSIIDTLTVERVNTATSSGLFLGERNVDWLRIYVPAGSQLLASSGWQAPDQIYFNPPVVDGQLDPDVAAEEGDNATVDGEHGSTTIYRDSGKTVFANWSMVDPGQSAVITLKYLLPFKLENKAEPLADRSGLEGLVDKMVVAENNNLLVYSLMLQKQPGAVATMANSTLTLAPDFKIDWSYPADLNGSSNGWQAATKLDSDKYWAAVIEKSVN